MGWIKSCRGRTWNWRESSESWSYLSLDYIFKYFFLSPFPCKLLKEISNSSNNCFILSANRNIEEEQNELEERKAEIDQQIASIENEKSLKNSEHQRADREYQERRKRFQVINKQ